LTPVAAKPVAAEALRKFRREAEWFCGFPRAQRMHMYLLLPM
jgi:hypothetical protein